MEEVRRAREGIEALGRAAGHKPWASAAPMNREVRCSDLERWEQEMSRDIRWESMVSLALVAVWALALLLPVLGIIYMAALLMALGPWGF